MVGRPKREPQLLQVNQDLCGIAYGVACDRIGAALYTEGKVARAKAVDVLREEVKTAILGKYPETDPVSISQAIDYVQKKAFGVSSLENHKRVECRRYNDLLTIGREVSILTVANALCHYI